MYTTNKKVLDSKIFEHCPYCASPSLTIFQTPKNQCMRSDGLILDESLLKIGCRSCGVIIGKNNQINSRYQRSLGDSPFDFERHQKVASGLVNHFENLLSQQDLKLIEIGAANFQTSLLIKKIKPSYYITSLDRHPERIPLTNEISIIEKDFFEYNDINKFDICFSNQVIEHFDDPVKFLQHSKELITENGYIITCCPTFSVASIELLFSDHITHFTVDAMSICANRAGLELVYEEVSSWDSLTHVYIFKNANPLIKYKNLSRYDYDYIFQSRMNLFSDWCNADAVINLIFKENDFITIYGAGEFTQLFRTYLPKTWKKIDQIVVDNLNGNRLFDKPIIDFDALKINPLGKFIICSNKKNRNLMYSNLINFGISETNIYIPPI